MDDPAAPLADGRLPDNGPTLGPTLEPLLTAGAIAGRVGQMGREISAFYEPGRRGVGSDSASPDDSADRPLTVLVVMTGGLVFGADLIRAIGRPLQLGIVHARSYRGQSTTSGELSLATGTLPELNGHDVLIVDDIFDTGKTLAAIAAEVSSRGAASVKTAVLLHKQVAHATDLRPTWSGFEIADRFVVGYGLDYDGRYRNRPDVCVLSFRDSRAADA